MSNPYGQRIKTTNSMGLGVKEYWVMLFKRNEERWQTSPESVQTDEDLSQEMLRAFPERQWSKGMVATARHRAAYNRGLYTKGDKPDPPACRYERKMNAVVRFGPGANILGVHSLEANPPG